MKIGLYKLEDDSFRVLLGADRQRVFLIGITDNKYSDHTEVMHKNVWKKLNPSLYLSYNWFEIANNYFKQHLPEHLHMKTDSTTIYICGKNIDGPKLKGKIHQEFWMRLTNMSADSFSVSSFMHVETDYKIDRYEHLVGVMKSVIRSSDMWYAKVCELWKFFLLAFQKEEHDGRHQVLAFDDGFDLVLFDVPTDNVTTIMSINLTNAEAEVRMDKGNTTMLETAKKFPLSNPDVSKAVKEYLQDMHVWYDVSDNGR